VNGWIASWQETCPAPGRAAAGGSWVPLPWDKARHKLAEQLGRCLKRWSDNGTRAAYEAALAEIKMAAEPSGPGLVWTLRDHELRLTRREADGG
jgi:hypothetical protein